MELFRTHELSVKDAHGISDWQPSAYSIAFRNHEEAGLEPAPLAVVGLMQRARDGRTTPANLRSIRETRCC
jgi:hypothetical protein